MCEKEGESKRKNVLLSVCACVREGERERRRKRECVELRDGLPSCTTCVSGCMCVYVLVDMCMCLPVYVCLYVQVLVCDCVYVCQCARVPACLCQGRCRYHTQSGEG